MSVLRFRAVLIVLLLLIAGCGGRTVLPPDSNSVLLGRSSAEDVMARYGRPDDIARRQVNTKDAVAVTYLQIQDPNDKPFRQNVKGSRSADYFFISNVLVGQTFESSWASDATDFNESLAKTLRKGVDTYADVVRLLGNTRGLYVYPLVDEPDGRALVYSVFYFLTGSGAGTSWYRKQLIVTLDRNGIVKEVDFRQFGR